jgi:hypothetical protein
VKVVAEVFGFAVEEVFPMDGLNVFEGAVVDINVTSVKSVVSKASSAVPQYFVLFCRRFAGIANEAEVVY